MGIPLRQDYEALIRFDCNYSDEELEELEIKKKEETIPNLISVKGQLEITEEEREQAQTQASEEVEDALKTAGETLESLGEKGVTPMEITMMKNKRSQTILEPLVSQRGKTIIDAMTPDEIEQERDAAVAGAIAGIYVAGDIVSIRLKAPVHMPFENGGRPWGRREVVDFAIATFKNLTEEEANALIEPLSIHYEEEIEDPEMEEEIGEKDIHREDVTIARRRHRMDIGRALRERPLTTEQMERFYRRRKGVEGYDDVEQPFQNNQCHLRLVEDISERPEMNNRKEILKQKMGRDNPKSMIIPQARINVKGLGGKEEG